MLSFLIDKFCHRCLPTAFVIGWNRWLLTETVQWFNCESLKDLPSYSFGEGLPVWNV